MKLNFLVAGLAVILTGCVTAAPLPMDATSPTLAYKTEGKTLVAVIDARDHAMCYREERVVGILRGGLGMPNDFTTALLMQEYPKDHHKTLAQVLSDRVGYGLTASGANAEITVLSAEPTEQEAKRILLASGASRLVTMLIEDWQVDVFGGWNMPTGSFKFSTNASLVIDNSSDAPRVKKTFVDEEAVKLIGSESYGENVLLAYRAKLDAIFADPSVRVALAAGPAGPSKVAATQ